MISTTLSFQGLKNTRDLKNIKTKSGKTIKAKKILRSGALFSATEQDLAILQDELNLTTIVDLRTREEVAHRPDPTMSQVTHHWCPIITTFFPNGVTKEHQGDQDEVDRYIDLVKELNHDVVADNQSFYPSLVLSEDGKKGYRRFFEYLLAQKEGSLLYHCSAGKDRVGLATYLLLTALRVDEETILEDYLYSAVNLQDETDTLKQKTREKGYDEKMVEQVALLNGVSPLYIEFTKNAIEKEYGSVENYLEQALGLAEEKRKQLEEMYCE